MAKVTIAFSADPDLIGRTVDLDDAVAATLVREGRARYAETVSPRIAKATRPEPGTAK